MLRPVTSETKKTATAKALGPERDLQSEGRLVTHNMER